MRRYRRAVRSFSQFSQRAARDGVRRTIDRNTRGGRDARGRYRRRVASADVLLLLLGRLGRGVFGFRRGRDVLLVVRHRGARRGLHRARARFERGSPSADAFPRRRREETTGTSASASRVPVPSRPAAVPPRRAMRDAREVRCPGDAADARARGCARRARGTSENHESTPGVLNGPLFETKSLQSFFFVVLERVGRLWGFMTRHHIKNGIETNVTLL